MAERQRGRADHDADGVGRRLDTELVRRGLARSRGHAVDLVSAEQVSVGGRPARRSSQRVTAETPIAVIGTQVETYVSRGAHKLIGALETFAQAGLRVRDRRCLDAGASTGGFTDVLLRHGAQHVLAVDVGSEQLAPRLREHPAVTGYERANLRHVRAGGFGEPVDLVVADVSFISLTLLLPSLCDLARADADFVVLVKPQFEVGRARLGGAGVVAAAEDRADAVRAVVRAGSELGLTLAGLRRSPLAGSTGNQEYLCWLRGPHAPTPAGLADPAPAGLADWEARIEEICVGKKAAQPRGAQAETSTAQSAGANVSVQTSAEGPMRERGTEEGRRHEPRADTPAAGMSAAGESSGVTAPATYARGTTPTQQTPASLHPPWAACVPGPPTSGRPA